MKKSDPDTTMYREMLLDLNYRLRLADDLFCRSADKLLSAAALEDWASRVEAAAGINDYEQALRLIERDLLRLTDHTRVVFPAELPEWRADEPDCEEGCDRQLKHLHWIAESMELAVNSRLLRLSLH